MLAAISSILALVLLKLLWPVFLKQLSGNRLPPGPPGRWVVGNMLDLGKKPWETYSKWRGQYGDVMYLKFPTQSIVVLGSYAAAKDLLDGRSNTYSDRPRSVMLQLLNWTWSFSSMPYGPEWRTARRYFHEHFSLSAIEQYRSAQLHETRTLLTRAHARPDLARQHIRSLPGSTIIRVTYGPRTAKEVENYVRLAERALDSARKALVPGAFIAEFIPLLRYIPGYIPGGQARRFADEYGPAVQAMRDKPFDEVKAAAENGVPLPSIAYDLIKQIQDENGGLDMTSEQDTIARNTAGVAYAGAADTTTASAEALILAMAMYPQVQKKAQAELDERVGLTRLPDFNDLPSLTYLRAIVTETLRWMPSSPLALPHSTTADDEYRGYHIPKGTIISPNVWGILHDPDIYSEPERFIPERFLDSEGSINTSVLDPRSVAFGFGRRACPGSDFAIATLTMFAASALHVFNIEPGHDEDGRTVVLTNEASDEAISGPVTFPRSLRVRSQQAQRLLHDVAQELDVEVGME